MSVALQEGVKLQCPLCPNQFSGESSRSFKVHVTDDHGKEESEAETLFWECSERRRMATIEALRERRRRERERRKRLCPGQLALEAYIDEGGELRVRSCPGEREEGEDADVTAGEYIAAMDAVRTKGDEAEKGSRLLLDRLQKRRTGTRKERGEKVAGAAPSARRARVGRPRGSRSVGISRLRRATGASVVVSDVRMGAECGVGDCAVRMRSAENLARHRRSHVDPDSAVGFRCTECPCPTGGEDGSSSEPAHFQFWSQLALHLWRSHRIDMELFACPECKDRANGGFRCFTQV